MSRIGKQPIAIPQGVDVLYEGRTVTVKGPKGTISQEITGTIDVNVDAENRQVVVTRGNDTHDEKALHGLYRSLIDNMVTGVTKGFSKTLEIVGVGYRVELQGKTLKISIGLNSKRPEEVVAPDGITFDVPNTVTITVNGIDKQKVGQTAASIRAIRKPEPYKGKGIRYRGEYVRILPGKSIAAGK